ncbi:MAG: hypothetical protein RLZZ244_2112 [Verrucomicrobiota bacterium]
MIPSALRRLAVSRGVLPLGAVALGTLVLPILLPMHAADAPAAPSGTLRVRDAAWYRQNATLLFEDTFDREETGTGSKAIGNGWNNATADRVPHLKQADLDEGILKIASATKEAGHQAHIHHEAGFRNGAVIVRFRLPGLSPGERLDVGFVDRECPTVHAGHLCYFTIATAPAGISLRDAKTGSMNLEIKKQADAARQTAGKLPEDLSALIASKQKSFPWTPDNLWHELVLSVEGDVLRACLDGQLAGEFRSEGFAHPMKRWMSFLTPSAAWIDSVQIWKVE